MASEESINEVLGVLENLGFTKQSIEAELREKVSLNLRAFSINRVIPFGEEKMNFDLRFQQEFDNNSIQLQQCKVFHASPVPIEDVTIGNINTAELENRMKKVDWEAYFGGSIAQESTKEDIRKILVDLWTLSLNDKNGAAIQDKLTYKYFPKSQWNEEAVRLSYVYESYTHTYTSFDNWNIHLCYMEMSGRYNSLIDAISNVRLQEVYTGYAEQLRREIMEGKNEFNIHASLNRPDGLTDITIPIRQTGETYGIDAYTVKYTPLPEAQHSIYNHIDTKLLEAQMNKINWKDDDALFIFKEEEEPEIKPGIALISEQLFHLNKDLVGADIADLLQLKYFIGVTFFEDNIPQTAWDTLEELPKREVTFNASTPVREALSLIAGKPVLACNREASFESDGTWMRYVFNENQKYSHTEIIKDFPVKVLEQQLKMLMPLTFLPNVKNQLLLGESAETRSLTGKQVFIEADPANKTLRAFDTDKKEIAVNFNLDANWKPDTNTIQYQRISTTQHTQEIKPVKKHTKRKGPKL